MIGWLTFAAYVLGWFPYTVYVSRFVAASDDFTGRCHAESTRRGSFVHTWSSRGNCRDDPHRAGCWRSDGELTPAIVGWVAFTGLIWPILGLPALAYWLARRKPTPQELERRVEAQRLQIEQLEKDAGITHAG